MSGGGWRDDPDLFGEAEPEGPTSGHFYIVSAKDTRRSKFQIIGTAYTQGAAQAIYDASKFAGVPFVSCVIDRCEGDRWAGGRDRVAEGQRIREARAIWA